MRMLSFIFALLLAGGAAETASAADLTKIDRTIAKEPAYKSKPKYCLLVIGPQAKFRAWLVLDGDTLYVDRNGNGDLTEPGEAVARRAEGWFGNVGSLTEPDGTRHTDLEVLEKARTDYTISIKVAGKCQQYVHVEGLGKAKLQETLQFAQQPQAAPLVHFNGPLTMKLIYHQGIWSGPAPGYRHIEVIAWIGSLGLGERTFATISTADFWHRPGPTVEIEFPNKALGGKPIRVKDRLNPHA